MKLYNSMGPNPHVVRMFAAEKGVELATEDIDIMAAANRQEDYLQVNPSGQLPALEMNDGTVWDDTKVGATIAGIYFSSPYSYRTIFINN